MLNFYAKVVKAEWNTKRIHSFLFVRRLLSYLKVVKASLDGTILARGLRGKDIDKKLMEFFE